MLLAIEMSLFAVMHIFAFPYKPYDVLSSPDPSAHYQGGFLGWKAFLDAFNLWDIVKAGARGFRWLFVGSRHRELDVSYEAARNPQGQKFGGTMDTGYSGSGGGGPPAYRPHEGYGEEQELGTIPLSYDAQGRGRVAPPMRTMSDDSTEDHKGLLSHSQVPAGAGARGGRVPQINVREPSPYGESLSREESGYSSERSQRGAEREGPFRDPPRNPFEDHGGRI